MSYEIFGMPLYALYYYGKACSLRPNDTAMWCAMAECYEANDNMEEAIKCLKRAECNPDKGLALVKLAKVLTLSFLVFILSLDNDARSTKK